MGRLGWTGDLKVVTARSPFLVPVVKVRSHARVYGGQILRLRRLWQSYSRLLDKLDIP